MNCLRYSRIFFSQNWIQYREQDIFYQLLNGFGEPTQYNLKEIIINNKKSKAYKLSPVLMHGAFA